MTKAEFTQELRKSLSGLPQSDIDMSLEYYSEMIDERMDNGISEESAVAELGKIEDIAKGILSETPLAKIVREKVRPKRGIRAWEIILLALGSPIWLSILLAFAGVFLAVYVVIWSVVICFYAAALAFAMAALAGIALLVFFIIQGNIAGGLFLFGCGIVSAGLAILFFMLGTYSAILAFMIGKGMILGIKRCFVGKERR